MYSSQEGTFSEKARKARRLAFCGQKHWECQQMSHIEVQVAIARLRYNRSHWRAASPLRSGFHQRWPLCDRQMPEAKGSFKSYLRCLVSIREQPQSHAFHYTSTAPSSAEAEATATFYCIKKRVQNQEVNERISLKRKKKYIHLWRLELTSSTSFQELLSYIHGTSSAPRHPGTYVVPINLARHETILSYPPSIVPATT